MPERSYFVEEYRKLHGIYPHQRELLKDPSVTLHLNSKDRSRRVLEAYIDAGHRFEPKIASSPAPYVDFGGRRWRGVKKVLAVAANLTAFDKSISRSLEQIYPGHPKDQEVGVAEWLERDTRFAWAYAEAIVEGRSFTPLSQEYQDRDETRNHNSLLAIGQADVDMRPFTMLRDADGNRNVLVNWDQRNIASWLAIAEADMADRPYFEVDFNYHQQMLRHKPRAT